MNDTVVVNLKCVFVMMLGMSPEEVVNQAVRMLRKNVNSEACIDSLLQEQVCSISLIWYSFNSWFPAQCSF